MYWHGYLSGARCKGFAYDPADATATHHLSLHFAFPVPFYGPLDCVWVNRYQKGKTNLDLPEQEIVSGSGISWAICKSAPLARQITTLASHPSIF